MHMPLLNSWYFARLVVKNAHQKDMCYNQIGLCIQKKGTILGSIINTIGRVE